MVSRLSHKLRQRKKNSSNDSSIKFDLNKSSSDTKSIVPHLKLNSPTANFDVLINCCNKEERTRQVSENPVSSSIKTEIDHQQRHQSNISSLYLENNSPASLPIRLILQPGNGSAFRADVDIVSERNMIKKGQHKRCVTYCLMRMQYLKWWSSYSRACGGTLFTSM